MSDINQTDGARMQQRGRITPRRPIKLQVCLTSQERMQLGEQARAAGYETRSAFVRARTLGAQRCG